MFSRFRYAAAALLCLPALASAELPPALADALSRTPISSSSVSVWISPAGENRPVLEHRARTLMQPASTIKIATTLAALDLLRPDYTWETLVLADAAPDKKGLVRGITFVGSGDPHLMIEQVWLVVERLRQAGVRRIEGDIAVDRSAFDVPASSPGSFDGAADRSYNVDPDAMLVNLKSVSVTLEPEANGRWARVSVLPALEGFSVPERVPLAKGACGVWKDKLKARFTDSGVSFAGALPASCGIKSLHVSRWSADEYLTRLLRPMLARSGIEWKGKVREARAKKTSGTVLVRHESAPMASVVRWVNKYSNNTMARHLFLTLSRADGGPADKPATLRRGRAVLEAWLEKAAGPLPAGTYVDNGSGLSRHTKISAETLGRVLNYGFNSYVMPELAASLPNAGYDGTMKKRTLKTGSAHIKTGLIQNVRGVAGYVTDVNARRWSVVVLMNGANLEDDQVFSQAVLGWCARGGAQMLLQAQKARGR